MAWWLECAIFKHFGWVQNPPEAIFEIFEAKEQKEKTVKYRKKSEIIGKYRKLSEKIGKNRTKEISVEISFRSPPNSDISAEISEILFLARTRPDTIGGSKPDLEERGPHFHFQSKYKKKKKSIQM